MDVVVVERAGKTFLDCPAGSVRVASESDVLDLLALMGENAADMLLLDGNCLDPAFFDLKSGLAGVVLLKLDTYHVRTAIVVPRDRIGSGKFSEFVLETNRGNAFRVFEKHEDAVKWMVGEGP